MKPRLGALVAWLLASGSASAGGYYYSDSGIEATGRGGAWIAGADTQFAQYYNPAGLIRVKGPTFNLGWSGVAQNVRWTQARNDAGTGTATGTGEPLAPFYPEVRNQAPPFNVPQLGFVTPIGDRFAFAFGFISPFAPSAKWDPKGPQRYVIVDSAVYQFGIGPSLAFQPAKQVTLGVGVQASYILVGRSLELTMLGSEEPDGDIGVDVNAVDPFTPTWNAGLLVEPHEAVSIGVSFTGATRYRAKGDLEVDFAGNQFEDQIDPLTYVDEASLEIKLPNVLRVGVAVRPIPELEIEAAYVWEQWSSLSEIVIDDVAFDVTFDEPSPLVESMLDENDSVEVTGPFELPAGLRDVASFRLGGEYRFTEGFEGRLGGFYEPSATPEALINVAQVDNDKFQIGAGGSGWLLDGRLRLDGAFAWLFFTDLNLTDSEVTQVNAELFPTCSDTSGVPCVDPAVVGNGKGTANGWIIGVQAHYTLRKGKKGKKKESPPPA